MGHHLKGWMWVRNYRSKDQVEQLLISEHELFVEFLRHKTLENAVAFGTALTAASKSLKRLIVSLATDEVAFNALKKIESDEPAILAPMSLSSLKELFPVPTGSMVCLLHVQLPVLTA
jgi:hypothetical protein